MRSILFLHFRRFWPAYATFILGLAVSASLGWRLQRQAVELDQNRLQAIAAVVKDRLRAKLQITDLIMRHAQDYFGAEEAVTDVMFREWCRKYGWSVTARWMHGLAFYTNLNAGTWRREVPIDPATWTEANVHALESHARRTPVELRFACGYCSDPRKQWPARQPELLRFSGPSHGYGGAISANTPQTTDRELVLVREGAPIYGACIATPVYEGMRDRLHDVATGLRPKAREHFYNWALCRGVLFSPIDYEALEASIWGDGPREVGVEIFASDPAEPETWLNPASHPPRAFDPTFQAYLTAAVPWRQYNARWTVWVYTLPSFEAGSSRYMAKLTVIAGGCVAALATTMVVVGLRGRNRQERLALQISEARDALAAAAQQRRDLSHDLHDGTIQSLYAIQLGLGRTAQQLAEDPSAGQRELLWMRQELDRVIAELRRFITSEEEGGAVTDLCGVLRALTERARAGTTVKVETCCDADASRRLTDDQAVHLANIAREALSNSLRHARAECVHLSLSCEPHGVRLTISDDGTGFDPRSHPRTGVGLTSMSTRAQQAGGRLDIQSSPAGGTSIVVRISPFPGPHPEPNSGDISSRNS